MKKRALLAWEHGAARGHITALRRVADAISERYEFDAALSEMDHAGELGQLCTSVFNAPRLGADQSAREGAVRIPTASWGEFLGDLRLGNAENVQSRVLWWQLTMVSRATTLLVANSAPTALLAARCLGIPAVACDTGFSLAPHGLESFPLFDPAHTVLLHDEATILAAVNEAAVPLGMEPLRFLPEIYDGAHHVVRDLPLLDPYDGLRRDPVLIPYADVPLAPKASGRGDEIFVYFSSSEVDEPGIVEAMVTLGVPVRMISASISDELAAKFTNAGIAWQRTPVPPAEIAARSRMMLGEGQHGTTCIGLAAGLPIVALPQHREQISHMRSATAIGSVSFVERDDRTAEQVRETILECYHSRAMDEAAQTYANTLPRHSSQEMAEAIRERLAGI